MFRKLVALAMLAAFAIPAQAGLVSSLLSFDGIPDIVSDDSVGLLLDGGDGSLDVGDSIVGLIALDPLDGNAVPAGSSVLGLYAFDVKTASAGELTLEAGDLASLLATAGVDTSGLVAYPGGPADAAFAIIESTTAALGTQDVSSTFAELVGAGFTAVLTAGFDSDDDFHTVTADGAVDLTDSAGIIAASLSGLFGGSEFGGFDALYSVSEHAFGGATLFLDQPTLKIDTSVFPPVPVLLGSGEVTIVGGNLKFSDATAAANGWHFQDDGNYNINAVPEPGTYAAFAAIGLVGFVARRRRNKK